MRARHGPEQATARPTDALCRWLATAGGLGFVGRAPGTFGSLVALPIAWALSPLPVLVRCAVVVLLSLASLAAVARYLRNSTSEAAHSDPSEVVLDEVVGCALALVLVPFTWPWLVAGFALFRVLDIVKPWPIRWLDGRPWGAVAVVVDDVVAGVASGLSLRLLASWLG